MSKPKCPVASQVGGPFIPSLESMSYLVEHAFHCGCPRFLYLGERATWFPAADTIELSVRGGSDITTDQAALAARIRQRDPEAIKEVVHAYLPQLLRAALGAGLDRPSAEDVTQSTFATFMESAHRFEGRSHVRTWLFGILYNKIAEARRMLRRAQDVDDIDEVFEQRFNNAGFWSSPPRPVDAGVFEQEVRKGIDDCLEEVPAKQRMAFVLREIEEMDSEEICNILEVTRTNLGVLLYRVRNRLRECLESKGFEGPVGA